MASAVTVASDEDVTEAIIAKSAAKKETPELMRRWREEHQRELAEKDAKENAAKDDLKRQAQKELEDWYNQYEERLSKHKAENRESQEKFISETANPVDGQEWKRVGKMCDFNKAPNSLHRMKSVLLRLKQQQ